MSVPSCGCRGQGTTFGHWLSSLTKWDSGDQTQVVSLGSRCLHLLGHPSSPWFLLRIPLRYVMTSFQRSPWPLSSFFCLFTFCSVFPVVHTTHVGGASVMCMENHGLRSAGIHFPRLYSVYVSWTCLKSLKFSSVCAWKYAKGMVITNLTLWFSEFTSACLRHRPFQKLPDHACPLTDLVAASQIISSAPFL